MLLTWSFLAGDFGNRALAVGFDEGSNGVEVAASGYQQEEISVSPSGYVTTVERAAPAEYTDCTLLVHLGAAGVAFAVGNLAMEYDGETVEILSAMQVQQLGFRVGEVVGRIYVGDPAALSSTELAIAVTGMSNPNILTVFLETLWINGVADATPTVYTAGTLDTFETPLELDVTTSATPHAFVFTGAVQAESATKELTVTDDDLDIELTTNDQMTFSTWALRSAYYVVPVETQYNCACEVDEDVETLAALRRKLLSATGYAAQAANPPPGVAEMFNGYLDTSQKFLYQKYKALQTERFFSWELTPGVRFYGLWDNGDDCAVKLNRYKIVGAWIQDLNNVWWPLVEGIDPTFYTLDANFGWPNYYEVRQCIEVFPAPQAAYTLWIKGRFNLLPFTDDEDTTTIDSEPVLNYAKYLAKAAKGSSDAEIYKDMAFDQVSSLIAGGHVTRRYIPGTSSVPVPTPPVMVHFES